jgi:general secretion pathway protein A
MYHQYFGLSEPPFSIAVNPRYLFMSAQHRDALAHLLYGVGSGGGFILLTGEVGTGKTTLNRCLLEQLPDNTDIAIILNPALSAVELLATVCDELAIEYPRGTDSLKVLTDALHQFLLANYASDRRTVLMIDEAQHLNFDVLEQIRLLTNLETDERKLLQIILIGQPELGAILARPELRQLNQRITARFNLTALSADEVRVYVNHRLQIAGLAENRALFSDSALREVYRLTDGIPRLINLVCDRAMMGAYGRGQSTVSKRLVREAAGEVLSSESITHRGPSDSFRGRAVTLIAGCVVVVAAAMYLFEDDLGMFDLVRSSSLSSEPEAPQMNSDAGLARGAEAAVLPPDRWQLDPVRAEQALWQLRFDSPLKGALCTAALSAGWQCETVESEVWDEVVAMNRPVLLDLRRSDGFAAVTVLLRIEGDAALIWNGLAACSIPLSSLTESWLNRFRYLWISPKGWTGPLVPGDQGPVVRQVVEAFAALDGLPAPPLDVFTPALEQRVMAFQAATGLEVDGVIGARTLQTLNDQLGRGWWSPSAIDQFNLRIGTATCL